MTIAYTIGNEANYDKTLVESKARGLPMRKTGKGDQGRDADYPGGWVFEDLDRAVAATLDAPMLLGSSAVFAVYEIELPGTWDECTYVHDGARHLLVDAEVRRKVERASAAGAGVLIFKHDVKEFFDVLPGSPICAGYKIDPLASRTNARVDLRSDRQKRTDHARSELVAGCLPRLWPDVDVWAKAVEWYENRPSGGETDGEALFACLCTFCSEAKAISWSGAAAPEREAFEHAAGKLQRHIVR